VVADAGDDAAAETEATDAPQNAESETTEAAVTVPEDLGMPTTGDPEIFALSSLPDTEVCALTPKDELEAIVGVALDDGSGLLIEGLGTNCLFYGTEDFSLQAKVEFSAISWTDAQALADFAVEGVPEPTECSVAGRDALCIEPYENNDLETGATVYVKLGGDDDIPMFVEAAGGQDTALAVAELALSNLSIG
jgi:hypothetical protein